MTRPSVRAGYNKCKRALGSLLQKLSHNWLQRAAILISAAVATLALYSAMFGAAVDGTALKVWSVSEVPGGTRTIAVSACIVFLLSAYIGLEIWKDHDELETSVTEIHRLVRETHESRLQNFVEFLAQPRPEAVTHILAWRGYEELFTSLQYAIYVAHPNSPLSLSIIPYETSDIIPFLHPKRQHFSRIALRRGIKASSPEILVLDYEVFTAIRSGELNLEICPLPGDQEKRVIDRFAQPLLELLKSSEGLLGVPLSYDVNAVSWNSDLIGRAAHSSLSNFIEDPASAISLAPCTIGVLDWYLPIMGLFSASLNPRDPFLLTPDQFVALSQRMTSFKDILNSQGRRLLPLGPEDLALQLMSKEIGVALGGGSWVGHTGPTSLLIEDQIAWTIPSGGGFVWVEALTFPCVNGRNPQQAFNNSHKETIVDFLLNPANHINLSQRRMCSGLPALRDTRTDKSRVVAIDSRGLATDPANHIMEEIGHRLRLRRYPPDPPNATFVTRERWEEFWNKWREDLL